MPLDAYLHHQILDAQALARLHQRGIPLSQTELSIMRDALALLTCVQADDVRLMSADQVADDLAGITGQQVVDRVYQLIHHAHLVV